MTDSPTRWPLARDEGFTAVAKDEVGRVGHPEGAGMDLPALRLQVEADHGASPHTLLEVRTALVVLWAVPSLNDFESFGHAL